MTTLQQKMEADMRRLKSYFPYRYVWGAIDPNNINYVSMANVTKRQANEYARKGWTVYVLS